MPRPAGVAGVVHPLGELIHPSQTRRKLPQPLLLQLGGLIDTDHVELRPLIPVHIPVTGAVPQFQHTAAGEHQLPGGRLVFRHPRQLPAQKTQMIALQFRHGPPHQQNADAGVLQGHQHCLGPHCPALPATSGPAEGHILLFTLQKLLLPGVGPLQLHHLHAHLLHSSASFASTTFTVSGPLSVRSSSVTSSRSSAVSSLSSLASISSI